MTKSIKPEDIPKAIKGILEDYEKDVIEKYGECGKTIADSAVTKLKSVRFNKGYDKGKYAKSWAVKQEKGAMNSPTFIVYNKKYYRLTHLLEYGHVIRNGTGRTYGTVKAQPHIKKVEEWVQNQLPKELIQKLGGR